MIILSNKSEELKSADYGKFQIVPDKIRIKDEPYESFFVCWNRDDALLFKKEFNKLAHEFFGIQYKVSYQKICAR